MVASERKKQIWDGSKEISRLLAERDMLYKALKGMMRVCPSERHGMKLAEYEAARLAVRQVESGDAIS